MIIDGDASPQELKEAWIILLGEYFDLKGDDTNGVEFWQLSREIMRIEHHLFLLQSCIDFLSTQYSEIVANSVRKLGYTFRPTEQDPIKYLPLLKNIAAKAANKYVQLKQLTKELSEKVKKTAEQSTADRSDFERMLIQIEEMQRTNYDIEVITVSKFVLLEKKYWNYIDSLKAKHQR